MKFANLLLASAWAQDKKKDNGDQERGERGRYPASTAVAWNAPNSGPCTDTAFSGPGWTVESPHYYSNHQTCTRNYQCPENTVVFYKWNRLSIESHSSCYYDYVKLSGKTETGATVSEYHCGEKSASVIQ